jgi:hypothetical protein
VKGKITMRIPAFRHSTAPPTDPGYGKRFVFSTEGESSFHNFTASEIIAILVSMRGGDAMTARFGEEQ